MDEIQLLRLRRGLRYVVAVQDRSGKIEPYPFWDASHALIGNSIPPSRWNAIRTHVFTEISGSLLPSGTFVFSRQDRNGTCLGAVLWSGKQIYPTLFNSVEDAVAKAWSDIPRAEAATNLVK
ncbi:hypothetical protein G6L28_19290 [Agrobacterium larrymoorei]|uniref:hypothetical protein n=1 Tax=Agrobacterium larrymoorei TaxID=160699 RepID=UPI0015727C46|nr:hypothetical protein [Agrobacterium larrymoorei]NTJ44740.1 hypothetical protein [Agrobacterium larrymoorei]